MVSNLRFMHRSRIPVYLYFVGLTHDELSDKWAQASA